MSDLTVAMKGLQLAGPTDIAKIQSNIRSIAELGDLHNADYSIKPADAVEYILGAHTDYRIQLKTSIPYKFFVESEYQMARYAYEKLVKDYFRDLAKSIQPDGTLDPRTYRKYFFDPLLIFVFHLAARRAKAESLHITNNWRMSKKEIFNAMPLDNIRMDRPQDHTANDKTVYGKDREWDSFKDLLPVGGRGPEHEKTLFLVFKEAWLI